ncbi:class I SAM-dependent methyltransferase [Streptomonospora wellingtoniae]|uniref:Class I SAM-dependent methyltransferase n=1 Tax=Streptomonospora wellingtoniae TaxID=3075544 RepID=A0ABU2KUF3_9ACTN|nr:class I SAM-dependent methyltransferase [Streptomonospora sp. DSM 45055]MDT0302797.1 class I SAM-dependent methyltransferase [Streptomonospora sp. DSM 45055]
MTAVTDLTTYWDRYAGQLPTPPREDALKDALRWCQYPDHGPGPELLGEPATTLELGCGRGDAVAALATTGVDATGVDLSAEHVRAAHEWWGDLPNARFVHADVVDYLSTTRGRWEAAYSIWGAVWFTDPDVLLPLVRERLVPGGRLTFAQAPAVPGAYGVQGIYATGFRGRKVWVYRWAYEPETWEEILTRHGFTGARAWVEPAPEPDHVGTLIVRASA